MLSVASGRFRPLLQHHSTLDSKVHVANMGFTWILSAPCGPHVGPMSLAIRDILAGKRIRIRNIQLNLSRNLCHHMSQTLQRYLTICYDDVIKWKHFPCYRPFVPGIHRSPVNSPHKGQWRGALIFYLICARINGWVNNHEASDIYYVFRFLRFNLCPWLISRRIYISFSMCQRCLIFGLYCLIHHAVLKINSLIRLIFFCGNKTCHHVDVGSPSESVIKLSRLQAPWGRLVRSPVCPQPHPHPHPLPHHHHHHPHPPHHHPHPPHPPTTPPLLRPNCVHFAGVVC